MPVTLTLSHFDPEQITQSGQCFRMVGVDGSTHELIAFGRCLRVTTLGGGRYRFTCTPAEMAALWRAYFDLDTDYAALLAAAPPDDAFLQQAIRRGHGLRILRQEPWETLCGFILSQRKNLKAIRLSMETLAAAYGAPIPGSARNAFPAPARLAACTEAELRALGLGYRAPYILDAARRVASGALDLAAIAALPDEALLAALMQVNGVGMKVADCVMLFAYARYRRAPVDVWIRRVIDQVYGGASPFAGYGAYAGIYQQYLFVRMRDGDVSV
ncbi:MAG: DNA glycosylase [Candidatus Limiplasma sp.]|nr:DNA glycosylase [Candidatus Limiplasma sp.]MEA5144580.1 DNA glycosylase [Candidatus Limiplasma sp.]